MLNKDFYFCEMHRISSGIRIFYIRTVVTSDNRTKCRRGFKFYTFQTGGGFVIFSQGRFKFRLIRSIIKTVSGKRCKYYKTVVILTVKR